MNKQTIRAFCEDIVDGKGWVRLENFFEPTQIEKAKDALNKEFDQEKDHKNKDASQNNYTGLTWGLLSQGGGIIEMVTHQDIMAICRKILGKKCRLSSLSANTVVKGMPGQVPHLDYPYHRDLWPDEGDYPAKNIMSLTVIMLLTDFTKDNGATALIPRSQRKPTHPDVKEDFYASCEQVEGKAGDVMIIAGSLQHCAMENKTDLPRQAILMQMVPLYVTPFELIKWDKQERNEDLRTILALDHEHPTLKKGPKNCLNIL